MSTAFRGRVSLPGTWNSLAGQGKEMSFQERPMGRKLL